MCHLFLPLVLVAAALLAPGLCRGADGVVEVGALLPLTGGYAPHGLTGQQALTLAEEAINAHGGIKGRPVRFVVADTASDPAIGLVAARQLVEERRVAALMGGHSSAVAEEVGEMMVTRRFPFLITSATADRLTDPATYTPPGRRLASLRREIVSAKGGERTRLAAQISLVAQQADHEGNALAPHFTLFRIAPLASDGDEGVASFLTAVAHPRSAMIVYERSLAGGARAAQFALTLKRLGIPLLTSLPYNPAGADFRPLLHHIRKETPDLLYVVAQGIDAPLFMRQGAELGIAPRLIVGAGEGFADDTYGERAAGAGDAVFVSPPWTPRFPWPGAKEFADDYRRRFGNIPDHHGAQVYAGALVMADALNRATGLEPRQVTEALRATDLMTPFGPIMFERRGKGLQQNRPVPLLLQWLAGKPKIVWPQSYAEAPYVYPIDWLRGREGDNW
ncbi:MAG: ABC transporter substrate-binding protein [Nitrospinae bacterium]|nr:ABC transporter substrate-binding protein [Nitrospinota bacterium]